MRPTGYADRSVELDTHPQDDRVLCTIELQYINWLGGYQGMIIRNALPATVRQELFANAAALPSINDRSMEFENGELLQATHHQEFFRHAPHTLAFGIAVCKLLAQ